MAPGEVAATGLSIYVYQGFGEGGCSSGGGDLRENFRRIQRHVVVIVSASFGVQGET